MKLRYSPTSPYVRKVNVTAIELGLDNEISRVTTNPWDPQTDLPTDNPLGKVPALMLDDDTVLFDSPVICEYLNNRANGNLIPNDALRWPVLCLQALGDGILDAAVARLLESRRPAEYQFNGWVDRQRGVLTRALDETEKQVNGFQDRVDLGQITIAVALGYLDFRFQADDWRPGRPQLAQWYEGFSTRPSMQQTIPQEPA